MSTRFNFSKSDLEGVFLINRKPIIDNRGSFSRMFCVDDFKFEGFNRPIKQINRTVTIQKGAMRGMHLQLPPSDEYKIVSCLKGKVHDVVLDIRRGSPTFLQSRHVVLSSESLNAVLVPPGCAHGFQTLEDNCEMLYLHSENHNPNTEMTVNVLDPKIGINWPIEITGMSLKDKNSPMLNDKFKGI